MRCSNVKVIWAQNVSDEAEILWLLSVIAKIMRNVRETAQLITVICISSWVKCILKEFEIKLLFCFFPIKKVDFAFKCILRGNRFEVSPQKAWLFPRQWASDVDE